MWRVVRENATCALFAALGCALCGWLALYGMGWNDYEVEVQPAYEALAHGHPLLFLQLAPVYGGSLIERAPFAMAPRLWDGGDLAVYRAAALPCLLAAALLGMWIVSRLRRRGASPLARAVALGVCVANPVTLIALETGHPEELLGAALCVAAALIACADEVSRRRAATTGLLIGLAIANKQWALVAVGPVLAALPPERRRIFLLLAGGTAAALLAPLLVASASHFTAGASAAASPASTIFQPWQIWWFFGSHGASVHGLFGEAKPGYRTGPPWAGALSHPAVLAAGFAVGAALLARTRGARLDPTGTLVALALVLLTRCILDTWDTGYYTLPFLFALLAWEIQRSNQPPLYSLAASVLVWLNFKWMAGRTAADTQAIVFLALAIPATAWLAARTIAEAKPRARSERDLQETTVRSFGKLVSTSGAAERTTARSSMRTPSVSGR